MKATQRTEDVMRYADMFAALGAEPRLRIMQLLLTAHPQGLVVSDIQRELQIPASTLSHHLDKLKSECLVGVQRHGTFLRYTAATESLRQILNFLYAGCCTRNQAMPTGKAALICTPPEDRNNATKVNITGKMSVMREAKRSTSVPPVRAKGKNK